MAKSTSSFRLDLQVLRAVAVGAVLLYHLWPARFPGGFIGVDVFFVISGFLITSHLLRSATGESGIKVFAFWGNRARRLLPLACVALLATIAAIFVFLSESTWKLLLRNVIASGLYVQNWLLASDSVDYLARDQAPVITQHFWSLSVEEQFYIAWPLIMLAACAIALRSTKSSTDIAVRNRAIRRNTFIALAIVFVASLVYSLWMTEAQPGVAYFATTTRAWEFAAGALLVFVPSIVRATSAWLAVRTAASWAGFVMIVATVALLPDGTPFPGVAALLPVVGAALFIWAGDVERVYAPTVLTRVRPVTWLGDISYGVYLWHWPLVVILPFALGQPLTTATKIGIVAASLLLAVLSKAAIEDPFRYGRFWKSATRRSFYPALAGMVAVTAIAGFGIVSIERAAPATAVSDIPPLGSDIPSPSDGPLTPSIANRGDDRDNMYDCFDFDKSGPYVCSYGPENSDVSIAIAGDSHAAHLLPGLILAAEQQGWRLTTYVGMNCDAGLSADCGGGQDSFDQIVAGDYDLVLVTSYRGSASPIDGVEDYWSALIAEGVPIVPVADVPFDTQAAYTCVDASGGDASVASKCTMSVDQALDDVPDRVATVSERLGLDFVDITDIFCDDSVCQTVINNVIVYQDTPSSHLTATFSGLLAPRLASEIAALLP